MLRVKNNIYAWQLDRVWLKLGISKTFRLITDRGESKENKQYHLLKRSSPPVGPILFKPTDLYFLNPAGDHIPNIRA